ncbi:MAG: Holliday junction resolvase RuvX [Chloroflexota bacterium]
MRILALDVGDARIGTALTVPGTSMCMPAPAHARSGRDEADIATILASAEREGVSRIVVGLPISLDGSLGPQARRVRRFAADLRKAASALGIAVDTWDERFSTTEAEARLREAGRQPSRERSTGSVDSAAAAIILEAYLQSRRSS